MEIIVTSKEDLREIFNQSLSEYFAKNQLNNEHVIATPEKLLGTKEICEFLNISEPTLIRWKKKGKIPYIEVGNSFRFDKAAVIKALQKKSNK